MAEDDESTQSPRTKSSTKMRSASSGSISQLNVNVSDLDGLLNLSSSPPSTTTISTIAVQADEARIVLAVLRSADVVRVRIQQMEPDLLDIGSNLGDTIHYQTVHEELISKLKAKQDQITELLTRADDLVSQQKSYNEVYEAMARSLGDAWKELNLQLEGRRNLLNQAIRYHTIAARFQERMNEARSWFSSLEQMDLNDQSLEILLTEHDFYRKEILEASLATLNEGQILLERIKDLGSLTESNNQHSIVAVCYEVEHLLGLHQDERHQFEEEWEKNRKLIQEYVQMSLIRHDIDQIFDWVQNRGERYLENTELGSTIDDIEQLKRIHAEMDNESQMINERVLRCMRAADSWVHTGLARADRLHAYAHTLLAVWEKWTLRLDSRRRLLRLAHQFYLDSSSAFAMLDTIENRLRSFSSNSPASSEDLLGQYQQINEQLIQSCDLPLRQGHLLLEKTSSNDIGTQMVRERVYELERRIEQIRYHLREEYERLDRQGSSLYQTFDHQCSTMESWLKNVLERFLHSNRMIIDSNQTHLDLTRQAHDFFDTHQNMLERDVKAREDDMHQLETLVRELQSSHDRHGQIARARYDSLLILWERLLEKLTRRHALAQSYVDFRHQAEQLYHGLASIDEVIQYRDNIDLLPESAVKHIEETWRNLRNNYQDLINLSKRIRHVLETESEQLDLQSSDTHRSIFEQCEQITRKFEQISSSFDGWLRKLIQLRDFKNQWQQFMVDARNTIEKVHRFELNLSTQTIPITDEVEKYQRVLSDFANRVQDMTREVEDRLRTAEQLGMRGETHGQKEQIVNELVKVHQQYLTHINHTRSFLHTIINFYKNTSKIETQIINNSRLLASLPTDIRSTEVLVRQYESEREKIIQTYEQCRQDAQTVETKANQCGVTTFLNEIRLKVNEIDSKYTQWQRQCEENTCKLKQRVEWCQFLDDKYKIVYEMDSLQQEIDKRQRQIPQSYKEAMNRTETMQEIHRLYDNCERSVRRVRTTAQIMLEQKHPEYEQVEREIKDVERKLTTIHHSVTDYREHMEKVNIYYRLIDEVERWHQESSQLLIRIGEEIINCHTEHEAKALLDRVSSAIDQGKEYEQEKMKYISTLAIEVFGPEEGHHRIKHVTAKNIELINAFIKVHQDISVVQRNFEHRKDLRREHRISIHQQLPHFVKPLKDVNVQENTRFTLECIIDGSEPITVTWLKDQSVISSLTHDIQYERGLATLTLVDAQRDDSGYYTCRANNGAGTVESSAYLIVQAAAPLINVEKKYQHRAHVAPTFIEPLRSQDVSIDSTVIFECILYAEPSPYVVWERDGIELCQGQPISHSKSNRHLYRLTLRHVQPGDSGQYGCRASNFVGEATSVADLRVFSNLSPQHDYLMTTGYEPRLTEPLKASYSIREGQPVKLSCRFDAVPKAEILWMKDGVPIDFEALGISRDFKVVKEVDYTALLIKEAFPEDTGSYTVLIQNPYGEARSFTQLTVEEFFCRTPESEMSDTPCKPVFVQPLLDMTLYEGEKLKLHAAINAHPEPEIIWYCNNTPLKSTRDLTLTFDGQLCTLVKDRCEKENDSGFYRITAVNSMGQAESTCQVTILDKGTMAFRDRSQPARAAPSIVQLLEDRTVHEGERLSLQVRITGQPKPQVIWYKDNQPLRNTHDHKIRNQDDIYTLEIPELFMDDAGIYTVKAINIEGDAKCSCVLTILPSIGPTPMNIEPVQVPLTGFAPEFLQLFTDRQTTLHSTVKLEARLTGAAPLNTYWLFNGVPLSALPNNPRYQQRISDDTYSLTIQDVSYEDAGRYTLHAENSWGNATCTAELFVPPTPTTGTDSNSNMLSDLLVEMSPSPPLPRKRQMEMSSQQQQQQHHRQTTAKNMARSFEQSYEQHQDSSFISSNTNTSKRYRPLQASLERTHSLTRDDDYHRRQYPKSIDVFIPYDLLEKERNAHSANQSTTMTRSYEYEIEERRRSSSATGKQQRQTELEEEREYLRCLRDLTNEYEKAKRQKKSMDNRKRTTTVDTQEEYESIEEVYHQRPVTKTTTTTEEMIQRSTYRMPTSSSATRTHQFEQQFVDNFALRSQGQPTQQHQSVVSSYSTRNEGEQRLTASQRSFSEEVLFRRLIPTAKQIYTTNTSATTSEAGFVTSDEDLTTMEYRLKRKERLKPIRIYSSTSSIPGETSVKYVRTERQPVELMVPKPQVVTTQGEHSTTVVKDVRRSTGKITTNIHQHHQRTTIEGEHEVKIIKEPISAGLVKPVEFTIPKPVEVPAAEHSSTVVVESKKGGRFQTLDVSSALTREHTLAGEHELRVIPEPISSGLHNRAVELLFPKPPLPPPPSHHSSTVVKQTRAAPSSMVVENIQRTLKGEHELRLVDQPIQSGALDSVELIVPKSVTETAEHTTTIVTETQPHRRVLEVTGSGRKMESEHETKFYRDSVRVEEEIEVKLPKQQVERAEHTTTLIKHSRGKAPIIEVDTSRQVIEGEHEMKIVEESVEARANAMQLLVAKPQAPAEHSTTIVKEQRAKPQVYAIDRTQVIPGEHETKYYDQPVEALGEMQVLFPKKQPVVGPLEGEHMSTIVKQVQSRQVVYDDRLREIPGEHVLTVVDSSSTKIDRGHESEVEFIVPKPQTRRVEEHSTTVLKRVSQRPVSSSDYDEVFASSAGEEENLRRRYRYEEEEESGWTSAGEHSTTYVKHARAKYEPVELVVDKPKIMPSVSTLIADIQGPAQITAIRPTTVIVPEDSSVKLDMELNSQHLQEQFDEMELVLEKPLVRDSSTKVLANIEAGLEVKSFRPTTAMQQQTTTVEESSSSLTMQMQQEQEEALELRIRKPHIEESSSVVIANIQPGLGIQGQLKPSPYVPPPIEESSTALTMDLNADQPVAPFELIIPRIGVESSTSTVLAQVAPAIAGIRAKIDAPPAEKSTSEFVLEQRKRADEEVELIMPKPKRIEKSSSTMIAGVEATLETKAIRATQVQPETSTSTFYLDQTIENVIPEAVEIRVKPPVMGESSTTVFANVKATLDTQQVKMLGNPYQPVEESSSAIILDTVSSQVQPPEVELILPRPQIRESKSVVLADVRPTLDTSQTHVVIAPPVQAPVKSSSELILQQDERAVVAPVELHLHRQPSSHTLVAKLDDTRIKQKDMYVLGAMNQQEGYITRDSSSTLYTDLNRPTDYRYQTDQRSTGGAFDEQRREFSSRMTAREKVTTSGAMTTTDNSSTFITEIEPRQLEPVEFLVSGSLTGPNNTLEQFASGTTSQTRMTKQTVTSRETRGYNTSTNTNINQDQSYAPYFIQSLRDQTVREGESVLFEVVVSALPMAEITWDKDGELISIDSAFRIDYYGDGRATLYIPETFLDDQGYYTCTARNSLGSCRTTARLVIKATSERFSPTRRQMTSSTVSSTVQRQATTTTTAPYGSTQSTPSYRVHAQSQPGSSSYQDYPTQVVTQVTEETEVIQIPPQQSRTQNNTISYTVEDSQPKFAPVAFQVSTNRNQAKTKPPPAPAPAANTGNDQDPNPFKIFGAKLRSRPLTGIVPSFGDDDNNPPTSAAYPPRPSQQQQSSSSFPSGRPDFSKPY